MSQNNLNVEGKEKEKKGKWILADYEKDESFKNIGIDEELIGTFLARDKNYLGNTFYIIEEEDGNIRKINDTTNLNKWMTSIEPGDKIRIIRHPDKKLPQVEGSAPKKPLQMYEVFVWKV
jgi:hypothetical protein